MRLKFSHTTEELVDLYVFNAWTAPWKKKSRQRIGMLLPLAFVLFAIAFIINGTSVPLGVILIVFAALWFGIYDLVYTKRLASFAKGYFSHEINERFWCEYIYEFKDEHIQLSNEYVDAKIQWKAIINYMERDDVFWLYETLSSAHIIPKRIMSEKEINDFKKILSTKLVRGNNA